MVSLNSCFRKVELLVCGSKEFNWTSLEEATDYDGGYSNDSETIRIFWDVFHNDFDEQQKRLFLQVRLLTFLLFFSCRLLTDPDLSKHSLG